MEAASFFFLEKDIANSGNNVLKKQKRVAP
jgi:hypothetical protein